MPLRDKLSRNLVQSAVEEFNKQHESNSIVEGQENDDFFNNSESVALSEPSSTSNKGKYNTFETVDTKVAELQEEDNML